MVRGRPRGPRRALQPVRVAGVPLAAILAGALLAACGQRGPLVLPSPPAEPPPRVRTAPSGTVVQPPAKSPSDAATGLPGAPGASTATRPDKPERRAD
jgi:predicted small lipoprotein YifL